MAAMGGWRNELERSLAQLVVDHIHHGTGRVTATYCKHPDRKYGDDFDDAEMGQSDDVGGQPAVWLIDSESGARVRGTFTMVEGD
jgi:hypothetical protein